MILTRLRSRNHHHANPLKVTKMWIGKCKIVRTKNDGGSDETMVYTMADHNHKRMAIPKVGLDDGMKKKVEKHYKNGFSATTDADAETRKKRLSTTSAMKANAKRGRPAKRKRALEYQPGEMPSPEKVSKEARVEENDEEGIFADTFEACL